MSVAYGIIALISLCMVGVCVLSDKKRDVWLLLVFVSVSVCNLGYFMLSISKDLGDALNSNRIAYLGNVFLPFFMLMMLLRFCEIKRKKSLMLTLVIIGIMMLAITTSPGVLPIYYSTVDIDVTEGGTKLIREYGPLHVLYYVYLIGYMLSMIVITFYAIINKRIKSRMHTVLLLCAVFSNIAIWLVEQFLPRGFEWLSVSYIICECLILAIYRSMYSRGLINQNNKTQTYTINILLTVFLLFFANFLRVVSNHTTPAMYMVSQIVVLVIYVGILVSWGASVCERIINKTVLRYLVILVGLMLFWMLMRTLRHTVFLYVFPVGQWCWYAYYISMILIPQLCLFAAKYISQPDGYNLPKKWYLTYVISGVLIVGILTNDLHEWAFNFYQGYENGWNVYQRGFLYYAAIVWMFTCIAMMIVVILKRCRIPGTHKMIWMPVAMLGIGVLYSILYAVDSSLFGFIEMTAALCFTVVAIWESSIKTGLIQSNSHYDELLKYSGLGVAIVDEDYNVYYCSDDALELNKKQIREAIDKNIILDGGIRVSGFRIKGGYTLWQEDLSELFDVLDELGVICEELKDSNSVIMQNYQMNKRIQALTEKKRLYDQLYRQTAHQINLLNGWLEKLIVSRDIGEKHELLRHIVVVGAYLKRRNNLILVNEQDGVVTEEEFNHSIKEMIKNLQLAGVKCACSVQFDNNLSSDVVMQLVDFYENVVENAFDGLEYLLARFFRRDDSFYCCVDVICKFDLTTLQTENVSVSVSDENYYTLSFKIKGNINDGQFL